MVVAALLDVVVDGGAAVVVLAVVSIRTVEDGTADSGVLVDVPVAFAHPPTTRVPASMSVPTFRRRNAAPPYRLPT